jgi:hypothetical protein
MARKRFPGMSDQRDLIMELKANVDSINLPLVIRMSAALELISMREYGYVGKAKRILEAVNCDCWHKAQYEKP